MMRILLVDDHAHFRKQLRCLEGLNASRQILRKKPDAPILMVSVYASQQLADEAKKAGIKGFCPKSEAECIIEAVEMLLRGKKYFPPVVH